MLNSLSGTSGRTGTGGTRGGVVKIGIRLRLGLLEVLAVVGIFVLRVGLACGRGRCVHAGGIAACASHTIVAVVTFLSQSEIELVEARWEDLE